MPAKRWDIDATGFGIGSAIELAGPLRRLLAVTRRKRWVAEQPEYHLLPHIEAACARDGSPWRLVSSKSEGSLFVVTLEWLRGFDHTRDFIIDFFSLLGTVAESNTHVHEEKADDVTVFDVTTGMLDGDGPFAAHGHTIRFRILPSST